MKAIVIHAAKDLRVDEREADTPGEGEVEVAVEAGGICGSDLHYFNHGGFGAVRLREPMILGHEVAGRVVRTGPGVTGLAEGDRVAVSPSRPCRHCRFCLRGLPQHCLAMRFYGSAMPMPHIQGAFRQRLVARAEQCYAVAPEIPVTHAAFAEPLSVVLHALKRAGPLAGARVLVTGCGPIGTLAVLALRAAGAREVVATDVVDHPLAVARAVGADRTINVAERADDLAAYGADKGWFDALVECSGQESAMRAGIAALRPQGVMVQLGTGNDVTLPLAQVVAKEIELRGTFRFHEEFELAVDMLNRRRIDVSRLLSAVYPIRDAVRAFEAAGDRRSAVKVQIALQDA